MLLLQLPRAALRVTRHVERGVRRRVGEATPEWLRRSPGVWTLVGEIAASGAVSDAITRQGAGFADGGGAPSTTGAG